ncbi:MAG: hypothetical protein LQ340_000556 [Diploschistes diacapsis]|nr:MAG: hypothetical protein LQ340_000556 [Diploschistes diacapsis]
MATNEVTVHPYGPDVPVRLAHEWTILGLKLQASNFERNCADVGRRLSQAEEQLAAVRLGYATSMDAKRAGALSYSRSESVTNDAAHDPSQSSISQVSAARGQVELCEELCADAFHTTTATLTSPGQSTRDGFEYLEELLFDAYYTATAASNTRTSRSRVLIPAADPIMAPSRGESKLTREIKGLETELAVHSRKWVRKREEVHFERNKLFKHVKRALQGRADRKQRMEADGVVWTAEETRYLQESDRAFANFGGEMYPHLWEKEPSVPYGVADLSRTLRAMDIEEGSGGWKEEAVMDEPDSEEDEEDEVEIIILPR